jgi:tRNA threonylcarbamoyladenosine biosynthesis protein TsaB
MILLIDTSTPLCRLAFIENDERYETEWEAGRELARGLLGYVESEAQKRGKTFADIAGIGVFKGPGSFTGLRIGLTVMNTLADGLHIPIVGASGEDWQSQAIACLERGDDEQIVLPMYGSGAHITSPRK